MEISTTAFRYSVAIITLTAVVTGALNTETNTRGRCEAPDMFNCDDCDMQECISKEKVCNGISECYNGKDESISTCGCAADEFQCDNVTCIDNIKRCDLVHDCSDGKDELNCDIYTCPPSHEKCANHACIPRYKWCNFINDCGDNSDETTCYRGECFPTEWRCANQNCIFAGFLCNGIDDCMDKSDEMNCDQHTQCANGLYVSINHTCDGWIDCKDSMTDELNCGKCEEGKYMCSNTRCIPGANKCDGVCDCGYNCDDEHNCASACEPGKFVCMGHNSSPHIRCLDPKYVCDGINQCWDYMDGSDESYCHDFYKNLTLPQPECEGLCRWCVNAYNGSCSHSKYEAICSKYVNCKPINVTCNHTTEWQCPEGTCIPIQYRCDGQPNCLFKTDEIDCQNVNEKIDCSTDRHFRCSNGQCIPKYERCDFKMDCWDGSDEKNCGQPRKCNTDEFQCDNKQCIPKSLKCLEVEGQGCHDNSHHLDCMDVKCPDGFMKCQNSTCIPEYKICDGNIDCTSTGTDEIDCEFVCPYPSLLCTCLYEEMYCENRTLEVIPKTREKRSTKYYLAGNFIGHNLTNTSFDAHGNVSFLDLTSNEITEVLPGLFKKMWRLQTLLLTDNLITSLDNGAFRGLSNVKTLTLSRNKIARIEPGAFSEVYKLTNLNLSYQHLTELKINTFVGLKYLYKLNLDHNQLRFIANGAFNSLKRLKYLDISSNPLGMVIQKFVFNGMPQLKTLYTDEYRFCCLASHVETCYPEPDEFSSCEDLMSNFVLRVCIWILGLLSMCGNALVILWRICDKRDNSKIHSFLITHLAIADMLMGVYLVTIASVDSYFRGVYIMYDISWRESPLCQFSGFISTFSSELSVFTLTVITMDRFVTIIFPFHFHRMGMNKARFVMVGLWILAIILSALPLCGFEYFNNFYGRSGVCLALHITNDRPNGWEYSVFVFLILNFFSFTLIMVAYVWMFIVASKTQAAARGDELQSRTERAMARRMALIVSTDFFCWMPIILLGFSSLAGARVAPQVYAWVAVFVLPVNSAINPIIYTISTATFLKQARRKVFKFRKSFMSSLATGNDTRISLASGETVSLQDNNRKRFFGSKRRNTTINDTQNFTNRSSMNQKRSSGLSKNYIPLIVKKESTKRVKCEFT